ncbi:MAG: hypothetical protein PSX36_16745 [bacterium]|nr:hypothetical protein [bacterium]
MTNKFIFRAFKAVDELETCKRFLEGHVKVLKDYGITNITTNNSVWMTNPSIYVIVAESPDGKEIYGGIRVHVADGNTPLPLEAAIGKMDQRVYEIIRSYIDSGTGELCGLWNAKLVAGYGLSLLLIRAGISIVTKINLESLFTICADYTMPMVKRVGFTVEDSIGDNGDFIYPNENYIAKVLRKMNAISLDSAEEYDKNRIIDLRDNPEQTYIETGPKGDMEIEYKLAIMA